jgi:chemotaxis protein histidine kinase CheA
MDAIFTVSGVLLAALTAAALIWRQRLRGAAPAVEVDDELRDVFLAEARSEIASMARVLPLWRQAPAELERVVPLRRTFHTLKGSGHMVGADKLAQLGAAIEVVLVRVMERELAPRAEVIDVVARAVAAVPVLVEAYAAGRRGGGDVAGIVAAAERLARQPSTARKVAVSKG